MQWNVQQMGREVPDTLGGRQAGSVGSFTTHATLLIIRCIRPTLPQASALSPVALIQAVCKPLLDGGILSGAPLHQRRPKTALHAITPDRHSATLTTPVCLTTSVYVSIQSQSHNLKRGCCAYRASLHVRAIQCSVGFHAMDE